MYCSQCGKLLTESSKFCSNCGVVIGDKSNKILESIANVSVALEQENIRHIQKSLTLTLAGKFKDNVEADFKRETKTKRFEETLCDWVFTNKHVYLLPATKDKSGWRALCVIAGPLYGLADIAIEKGINAIQDVAKRPISISEVIGANTKQSIPHWNIDEITFVIYEQSEGIPFINKTNSVNFVLNGPCHYRNDKSDFSVHLKIYGSVLNAGSFGWGYERPAAFEPLAKIFGLGEKDIQVR